MPVLRFRQLSVHILTIQGVIVMVLLTKRIFLDSSLPVPDETAFFVKANDLDCSRIIAGDENYTAGIVRKGRQAIADFDKNEPSDCSAIRQRFYFPQNALSDEEEKFPIAFAINVYQDYHYIELALSAMYSPQNQYCYHIDEKSDQLFKSRVEQLTRCLTNVHVAPERYTVNSEGFNSTRAFLACLRHLLNQGTAWKYALTLQGHDFPLHTNLELVRILDKLQGSNDVELREGLHRIPQGVSWDFVDLNILPKSNLAKGQKTLNITKGSVATSLSRAFVEFVATSVNATVLLKQLDSMSLTDEIFFATINHDPTLNAPGGYPARCLLKGTERLKPWISRFAIWGGYKMKCGSREWRHSVCLFGLEDLPILSNRKELFANKFFPSFDFSAAQCMHELLFNRTYLPQQYPAELDLAYYESLASVKYRQWQTKGLESEKFDCSYCSDCMH